MEEIMIPQLEVISAHAMLSSAEEISILEMHICIQQKLGKHPLFWIMFLLTLLVVRFKRNR